MTTILVTEPRTFEEMAGLTGKSVTTVVRLFVAAVKDYGGEVVGARRKFWGEWDGLDQQIARRVRHAKRVRWADKKRRQRKKHREQTKLSPRFQHN